MMAVLLSAALIAGMAQNTVPGSVRAQENTGSPAEGEPQENVSANTVEPAGQESVTEDEKEPEIVNNTAEPVGQTALYALSAADSKRDVTFTLKIYGYNSVSPLPDDMSKVEVIWKGNTEPVMGEAQAVGKQEDGYSLWKYLFKGLEEGTDYGVKVKDAQGQIGEIEKTGTDFEKIGYAINFYDGNELEGVQYAYSGNKLWKSAAPNLTKDGHTFAGWVTTDGGSKAFDFENTAITQVTNLYASWTPDTPTEITDFSQFKEAVGKGGTVTLTQDITLTETITVSQDVTIVSSGNYTIKRGDGVEGSMFTVSGGTLTLGGGDGTLTLDGGAVWSGAEDDVLNRGRINDGIKASSSLIHATGNGTPTVILTSNAVLQNNDCNRDGYGGAVTLQDSRLEIQGAKICCNKSNDGGGAVKTYAGSSVVMTGGEICQNEAGTHGGAFQIYGAELGSPSYYNEVSCKISGGNIRNNLASRVGGAIAVSNHSDVELSGTVIIGANKTTDSDRRGGGVGFVDEDTALTVSGTVQIAENRCNDNENNVAVGNRPNNKITIGKEGLAESANIGITSIIAPTAEKSVDITKENDSNYSSHFASDNPAYVIMDSADSGHRVVLVRCHTHTLTLTAEKAASCTQAGNNAYYTCSGCDKWFSDASGAQEITDKSSVAAAALGHDWGEWTVTKSATATESGQKERTCKRCQEKETEVIPATGGNTPESGGGHTGSGGSANNGAGSLGNIIKDINQGENVPQTAISTLKEELESILLTDEEKQQAENGIDIRIILEVEEAGDIVSAADKAAVEEALNRLAAENSPAGADNFVIGQYLNVDLYKLVGGTRTYISETSRKIRVVIGVPDSLKNAEAAARTFCIIRVHNGQTEILPDLDGSADTITIETDRFSTYAIAYKDSVSPSRGGSRKDDEPKTGDGAPLELSATLAMIAGFAYLLLYFADGKRGMSEETKKELVSRLIGWAKQGGKHRKRLALAAIFVLLVYYHSIGKKTCVQWKEVYGE